MKFKICEDINDLKITTESTDAYSDQVDMVKKAIIDNKLAGYLQYSIYEELPHIQMIEVAEKYRRQGIATKLLKSLQADFPNKSIDTGMRTPDGVQLFNNISTTQQNKDYVRLSKILTKLKSREKEIDDSREKFYDIFDNSSEEEQVKMRDEADKLQDEQDKLNYKIKNIEQKLEDIPESETFIK